jgi:septum formation protein
VDPADIPEEHDGDQPAATARRLAGEKAREVGRRRPGQWILGADTMVVLGGAVLGKPRDRDEARATLGRLSGREHRVVTGFSILSPSGEEVHCESVTTTVLFKTLHEREIEGYVDTGEPFGKAGSYAIQGIGAFMVDSISGSYTNVVGLPLCAVIRALQGTGALERFPVPG